MLSFDDLMTAITPDQAKATLTATMLTLGIDASKFRKAGFYDTVLTVVARMYANMTSLVVQSISFAFLEKAALGWLTMLAYYVFGITRPEATFATGVVQFTNGGGGVYSYAIGEVTVLDSTTKQTYFNTTAFTLNPGEVKLVPVQATVLGTIANAPIGQIDALQTVILGVTVTNLEAVAKLGTLSNGGPRKAYAFAVLTATRTDGTLVNINRLSITPDSSIGLVTIYVASPAGAPSGTDVAFVAANVEALARPDAVVATVNAATEVPVSTATQGYLFADYVRSKAESCDPSVLHSTDGGAADTALAPGQVPTCAVTVTVRIIP
jgi:hypothetical protein